jgi:hypothetical protein
LRQPRRLRERRPWRCRHFGRRVSVSFRAET